MFMLTLFHDKKCCKCIKLFHCILWDFIVFDLVLSWWRIKLQMKISAISQLAHKKFASKGSREKVMWEAYAKNWIVKCQAIFHETDHLTRYPLNSLPREFLVWFSYPSPILYIPPLPTKVRRDYLERKP